MRLDVEACPRPGVVIRLCCLRYLLFDIRPRRARSRHTVPRGDDARYFHISMPVQPGTLESKFQIVRAEGGTLKRGLQLSARAALSVSGRYWKM